MALIVQKYGGTSVGSVERLQAVAARVSRTAKLGNSVVVVVSAMGKTTDTLVKLARDISSNPSRREMDMLLSTGEQVSIALLSMALQEAGHRAISLTGAQVGIVTEAQHTRARILSIQTDRLDRHLNDGKVVVVAGFQGVTPSGELEITTLGRGGSDTSAVALAAALRADRCEIYTDVPGILTTDPRLVPEAQLMADITCDEMLELASLGAKVLHPRAVEIAKNYGVPLVVRSSWTEDPGTRVTSTPPIPRPLEGLELARPVDRIELDTDQAKVALLRVPDCPGVAAKLFGEIGDRDLDVDLIIQSIHDGNSNDIAFSVSRTSAARAESIAEAIAPTLGRLESIPQTAEVLVEREIAKISIVGAGMIGRPGVAAEMFAALGKAGVNIDMISTSEVKLSCAIDAADSDRAVTALCQAFEVNSSPIPAPGENPPESIAKPPAVRGVALDPNQARLAIRQVPDRSGMAARFFQKLAENNISVDMIIQSQRCRIVKELPTRDIAFTVARADAQAARELLTPMIAEVGCDAVMVDTAIAKVSVVGAAMLGQPGIAAKMFASLARNQINIQMITTSEIKISCVVAETDGVKALQAVHEAFELSGTQKVRVPA
ncbi:MAG: aspartate kinase [Cyanobacteriota bacterium]|nr:aspartate kinase [Cyanobacteriota bacterium]